MTNYDVHGRTSAGGLRLSCLPPHLHIPVHRKRTTPGTEEVGRRRERLPRMCRSRLPLRHYQTGTLRSPSGSGWCEWYSNPAGDCRRYHRFHFAIPLKAAFSPPGRQAIMSVTHELDMASITQASIGLPASGRRGVYSKFRRCAPKRRMRTLSSGIASAIAFAFLVQVMRTNEKSRTWINRTVRQCISRSGRTQTKRCPRVAELRPM